MTDLERHAGPDSWPRRFARSAALAARCRGERALPYWPRERVLRRQSRNLARTVRFAARHVPYYRALFDELKLDASSLRTADDLARLPILEPAEVTRAPDRFRPDPGPAPGALRLWSAGTSGVPRRIDHDVSGLLRNALHGERERAVLRSVIGCGHGHRELVLATPVISAIESVQDLYRRTLWVPRRLAVQRRYGSVFAEPADLAETLEEFRPDVVYAYGSCLDVLFGWFRKTGTDLHGPKAVVYTSDGMSPAIRRVAEEDFGVRVLSTYGTVECVKIGFECERHAGLHVDEDLYPVRIVDGEGRPAPAGTRGDVIVSNLVNRATILLNYRVGDEAAWTTRPCACGRSLPLLSFLQGRVGTRVRLPDGTLLHPLVFSNVLAGEPGLWQHQVVQTGPRAFDVRQVADPGADRGAMAGRLAGRFRQRFGDGVDISLAFVDAIPRTEAGKVRAVLLDESLACAPDEGPGSGPTGSGRRRGRVDPTLACARRRVRPAASSTRRPGQRARRTAR